MSTLTSIAIRHVATWALLWAAFIHGMPMAENIVVFWLWMEAALMALVLVALAAVHAVGRQSELQELQGRPAPKSVTLISAASRAGHVVALVAYGYTALPAVMVVMTICGRAALRSIRRGNDPAPASCR